MKTDEELYELFRSDHALWTLAGAKGTVESLSTEHNEYVAVRFDSGQNLPTCCTLWATCIHFSELKRMS